MIRGLADVREPATAFRRVVVVIPTRNRADLAATAIQSVLDAALPSVRILVSDNSTDPAELDRLEGACVKLGVERVRPPRPLPMADHWEWALERALQDPDASHVTFLTDRMVFQAGGLGAVVRVASTHEQAVVSYAHDRLDDRSRPLLLEQLPWTGRVLRIPTRIPVSLIARSNESASMAMPRLLNCVVPLHVVVDVRRRFGAACGDSIAPDYSFAFRCMAVLESFIYYDRPALLHYALERSNGASAAEGRLSVDHADFLANLDHRGVNYAAPVPGIDTVFSTIMHEYCSVREQCVDWPPADRERFLEVVTSEVAMMRETEAKRRTLAILEQHRRADDGSSSSRTMAWVQRIMRIGRPPVSAWQRLRLRASDLVPRVTTWESREHALGHARSALRPARGGVSSLEMALAREFAQPGLATLGVVTKNDAPVGTS